MSETIQGPVYISAQSGKGNIVLSPSTPRVYIGLPSTGKCGSLLLANGAASYGASISGKGNMVLHAQDGTQAISCKSNQNGGMIQLKNNKGKTQVDFQAINGVISLNSNTGKRTVTISAESASLNIGNSNKSGSIWLRNTDGKSGAILYGDGKAYFGSKSSPGEVNIMNNRGTKVLQLNGESGDIILNNADCAEEFDVSTMESIEPGSVVSLSENGEIEPCAHEYDKKVVGVISGAGTFSPGIVLDRRESKNKRQPVALVGKVYCKVDANYATIAVGDLLTSSNTLGHAMKAIDPNRSFGSILGKSLKKLDNGLGLIPILVTLQ